MIIMEEHWLILSPVPALTLHDYHGGTLAYIKPYTRINITHCEAS